MFMLMVVLMALGLLLLLTAPLIARVVVGREGDPMGVTRVLQAAAILLLIGALLVRPHSDETAAFPPPPASPFERER